MVSSAVYHISLLMVFGLVFIYSGSAKDAYDFILERITCEDVDPSLSYLSLCKTKSISRTVKTINIYLHIHPNVSLNDLHVKVGYFAKTNAGGYSRSIISAEENFCGYRAGTAPSHLISILWPFLKKASNMPDKCPLEGFINITNLIFEDKYLPPVLPEGRAKISIHVRNGPKRLSFVKVDLYIAIKPKGALKLEI